jgi:hypothetical protein
MTALKPNGGDSNPLSRSRAFVLLKSGRRLDPLNPDPQAWTDEDLAAGLARTPRWGGSSKWEHSLSVAQHSLTALALRELDGPLMFGRSFRDRPIQQRGASTSKSATNAGTSNWL